MSLTLSLSKAISWQRFERDLLISFNFHSATIGSCINILHVSAHVIEYFTTHKQFG